VTTTRCLTAPAFPGTLQTLGHAAEVCPVTGNSQSERRNMAKEFFFIHVRSVLVTALVVACEMISLAEDVIVTGCDGATYNKCPPSCPDSLGNTTLYSSYSTAVPQGAARSKTMFGTSEAASWAVTPTLATSSGAYRVYVSQGATYNCSTDIRVKLVASGGCTLADTNFVPQTEIVTTAFQQNACLNVWTPVAVITNYSRTPTILFSYASGNCSRWYMDEVRFESLTASTAAPAKITEIRRGTPITLSGTGPVNHAFALISSTNAAKPLNEWAPQQTNTDGTGAFTFNVSPGNDRVRFFRVITQ
jgi:hypothetical protein